MQQDAVDAVGQAVAQVAWLRDRAVVELVEARGDGVVPREHLRVGPGLACRMQPLHEDPPRLVEAGPVLRAHHHHGGVELRLEALAVDLDAQAA